MLFLWCDLIKHHVHACMALCVSWSCDVCIPCEVVTQVVSCLTADYVLWCMQAMIDGQQARDNLAGVPPTSHLPWHVHLPSNETDDAQVWVNFIHCSVCLMLVLCAFCALTLFNGCQEEHLPCKNVNNEVSALSCFTHEKYVHLT